MSFLLSVIPGWHQEFTTAANHDLLTEGPQPAVKVVGIRINDVTSGTSLSLKMGGTTVTYDNLAEGEVLTCTFGDIIASGSNVDSVIVYYL